MLFVYLHTAFFGVSEWFFQNIPWSSHFPAFDVHSPVGFQPHGPSHGSYWVPPHGPQVAISGYAIMKYLDADEGFCAGRWRNWSHWSPGENDDIWPYGYRSKFQAWTTDLRVILTYITITIWWLGYPIFDLFVFIYQFEPQKYLECWGQPWSRGNSCNLLAKMTSLGKTWKNTKKVLKNRVLIRNTTMMWEQKYFVHSSSGRSEPPGMVFQHFFQVFRCCHCIPLDGPQVMRCPAETNQPFGNSSPDGGGSNEPTFANHDGDVMRYGTCITNNNIRCLVPFGKLT